jgi:hypothetical protein
MRFILLVFFCFVTLTASAQFWRRKPQPQTETGTLTSVSLPPPTINTNALLTIGSFSPVSVQLTRSAYSIELAEEAILIQAKHNMRFREYSMASYNFSDLAALYLQQNRFSEAKWYLLQSNDIARRSENTRHLLDNLLILSDIKIQIGENTLAMADLQDARDVATTKGMLTDLTLIEKKIKRLQNNKTVAVKADLRYADAVEAAAANSKTPIN